MSSSHPGLQYRSTDISACSRSHRGFVAILGLSGKLGMGSALELQISGSVLYRLGFRVLGVSGFRKEIPGAWMGILWFSASSLGAPCILGPTREPF